VQLRHIERRGRGNGGASSNDAILPYNRPPLSKGYLRDETDEAPFVEDEALYADNDVDVLLGTLVSAVTPRARWLTTQRGRRYGYEQLLIATGARPRRLNVPGAELDGVFTLRSLADSASIRDAARGGNRARRRRWRLHRHGGGCFPAAARPSGGADPPRQRLVRPARLT